MAWTIIVRQIGILAILVLIGMLACRARVITSESKDFLARLIFYVTLPSMLLTNFSNIDITPRLLSNSLQALLLSVLVYNGLKKLDRNLITLKFLPYEKIKTKIHI